MRGWQRLARAGIGLFAVAFAVMVYLAIKQRNPGAPASSVPRIDPAAIAESTGGVSQLAKGTQQDYAIEYGRALTYADGTSKFSDGITVRVPQRSGRDFTLKARQAEVRDAQSTMKVDGDVQLLSSDGLDVKAASATFNNGEGIVRVPGAVSFTRGRMTGRSRGATFDRGRDVLWLLDEARVSIAPDASGAGTADVSAGVAGFARRDRYLRFERDVNIGRSGQRVKADNAMMFLAPDADIVQMLELRGHSSVTPEAGSSTTLREMSARDINMHYSLDGRVLQRVVLAGEASVAFSATAGAPSRVLSAGWIEMVFAEDGQSITVLVGRDSVQLQFPVEDGGPARRIRAVSLEAAGEAGKGITTAHFVDQVNFRETKVPAGDDKGFDREIRAQTLDAVVTPGMGAIEAANFGGGVRFVDDPTNASAPDLQYNIARGTAKLLASAGGAGAIVTDDAITIEARTIDLTLGGKGLVADADVRSVLKATRGRTGAAGTAAPKRPGMLKDDQPVNVTATHLVYDTGSHRATYSGEARLWQGETAVQGDTLVLDDQAGNLTANGNVRSAWRLADTDPKTGQVETKTTIATAADLVYDDAARRATYTTDARMNGPEGDVKADKIELYLEDGGGALERAEAYGSVSLRSESRTSLGTRLSYFAADARYVMSGTPVRIFEQLPAECRETVGRTLTFFRSTDSISVDGNRERRTQTTSGGKCPEPQSH